ncbi:MAG: hypothetical protein P8Y28_04370 [Gammaproteobacteria bacterium]|jgi:hypothetical protein
MLGKLPVVAASLQIGAGLILAAGLLFYIKRFSEKTRFTISALVLLIAALIYVLFALVSGNQLFVTIEIIGFLLFLFLVWLGYQYSYWFIAMGWLLHVFWDFGLHPAQTAPYLPQWYAFLCAGFDIAMALYVSAILIIKSKK